MKQRNLILFVALLVIAIYGGIFPILAGASDNFQPFLTDPQLLPAGYGYHFADVTGDGRADYISVTDTGIMVRRMFAFSATNVGIEPSVENWTQGAAFVGDRGGTFFADVTGEGRADAIAVNDAGILVRPSSNDAFEGFPVLSLDPGGSSQPTTCTAGNWTNGELFVGDYSRPDAVMDTRFADVTGDRRADAIAIKEDGIWVRPSDGCSFLAAKKWTPDGAYFGSRQTDFADVSGDGKADAIVVNDDRISVKLSDGSEFGDTRQYTYVPYYGDRGTYFADVTGDGVADAIAVNSGGIAVRRSFGLFFGNQAFADPDGDSLEFWTSVPVVGTTGLGTFNTPILFTDVTGEGRADAIIIDARGITLSKYTPESGDLCQADKECPAGLTCKPKSGSDTETINNYCQ